MTTDNTPSAEPSLRHLPSVDALLRTSVAAQWRQRAGRERLTQLAREAIEELRAELRDTNRKRNDDQLQNGDQLLEEALRRLAQKCVRDAGRGTKRVINATGVILHTNLGRAPLSAAARRAIAEEAAGYCALEYDIETGARGRRGENAERLLCELTGAEDALIVNNCAAAALLVLTALAHDGEAIISRGELVEIGGDFRVPDVMAQSGARMIEVGTTNRTRLEDYRRALSDGTKILVRVHPSNFRIVGFTQQTALRELAELARETGVPLYEDAGSGALEDLSGFGLHDEPVIRRSIEAGANLITFSADKLLGAAQAGLIVGDRALIDRLRTHPLNRALRASKITIAALEATLEAHHRETTFDEIPTLRMIAMSYDELRTRAKNFKRQAQRRGATLDFEIIEGESAIGGGAAPLTRPRTALLAVTHARLSGHDLEKRLRRQSFDASPDQASPDNALPDAPPVIARIVDDKVTLDLRTVSDAEERELLDILCADFA